MKSGHVHTRRGTRLGCENEGHCPSFQGSPSIASHDSGEEVFFHFEEIKMGALMSRRGDAMKDVFFKIVVVRHVKPTLAEIVF